MSETQTEDFTTDAERFEVAETDAVTDEGDSDELLTGEGDLEEGNDAATADLENEGTPTA